MLFGAERRKDIYAIYERSKQFGRDRSLLLASHRSDPTISARGEAGAVRRPAAVEEIRRDRRNGRNLPNFTIGRALFKIASLNLPADHSGTAPGKATRRFRQRRKPSRKPDGVLWRSFVAGLGLDLFVATIDRPLGGSSSDLEERHDGVSIDRGRCGGKTR
jgi:hypothetical protein